MRKKKKTMLSLTVLMILVLYAAMPSCAAEAAGRIVMAIEKATIGQGYIMEPQYVTFYDGESVADVTVRVLKSMGRSYNITGTIDSGFYLAEISDPNRGDIQVPSYILQQIRQQQLSMSDLKMDPNDTIWKDGIPLYKDKTPNYLGEFDYWKDSGWMYSVGDGIQTVYPRLSACDITPRDGDVIRWQFTMVTLGGDLSGDPALTGTSKIRDQDRDDICKTLASIREKPDLLLLQEVKEAYDSCMEKGVKLTTSKDEIRTDLVTLKKSLDWNVLTEVSWYDPNDTSCTVKYGTEKSELVLPGQVRAVKAGEHSINVRTDVWECEDYDPQKPGTYLFYPVIPDTYRVQDGVKLPAYEVRVKPFGDLNDDGFVNETDLEQMVSCLGIEVEKDEKEAICDLNADGLINMQDYSLLTGAISHTDVTRKSSSRIELRLPGKEATPGEEQTAELIVYSAMLDAAAVQFTFDSSRIKNLSVEAQSGFTIEKEGVNKQGCYVALGSRKGILSTSSIRGICIAKITFQCTDEQAPDLALGVGRELLLEGKSAVGYCNGSEVELETGRIQAGELLMLGQLNDGRVRRAERLSEKTTENGVEMEQFRLVFQSSDAQDVPENRLRLCLQSDAGFQFTVGEGCINGEIIKPFSNPETGIYYADGTDRLAGCFTGGCSPQKETCVLYAKLENASGTAYYKILVQRTGYAAVRYNYSDGEPLVISQWNADTPDLLSTGWSRDTLDLREWDDEGNPVEGIRAELPSTGELYLSESGDRLFAREPGDYRITVVNAQGETKGEIRVLAEYPYQAAAYLVAQARDMSMNQEDYHQSAWDMLIDYKGIIEKVEKLQTVFPDNVNLWVDANGTYTAQDTGTAAVDSQGYVVTSDYLRTAAAIRLKQAISEIKPQILEKRRRQISVTMDTSTVIFDGAFHTPALTVTDDTGASVPESGFTVKYRDNRNAGTAVVEVTGKEYYKGSQKLTFTIQKAPQTVTVDKASFTTCENAGAFSVKGTSSGGGIVTYQSSDPNIVRISPDGSVVPVKAGTANILVKAEENENYLASAEQRIQVTVLTPVELTVKSASVKKSYGSPSFSLSVKVTNGSKLTYKSGNKKVVTVSSGGRVQIKGIGTTVITVQAVHPVRGTAIKTVKITVLPKRPVISLKSRKSGQLEISWKKDSKVSGYEFRISTDKKFRKSVLKKTIRKNSTVRMTVKKLKSKKTYYVRMRSYKTVKGTKLYSSWSTVKKIKIHK